ncbi:hypothetical protein SLS63_009274 [Diaporthe eres]|uniref:Cytochrome P450 n=1 Tax=Diaporthe eres TaxID=83184 RepID=A0ABR1P056_DIAER
MSTLHLLTFGLDVKLYVLVAALVVVGFCGYVVYNLCFHPMSTVPGPFWGKISPLWVMSSLWKRKFSTDLAELHQKYGPIVRIAPSEISFSTLEGLETIYHGATPKNGTFSKQGTLQDIITNFILPGPNIITMHDRTTHRKLKGRIEPAFTPKALFQQEPIINAHIKAMCSNLDGVAAASGQDVINITDIVSGMLWNMVSDLAFGEPLLEGQRKPFERFVENCTAAFQAVEALNYCLPLIGPILRLILENVPFPVTSGHIIRADRLHECSTKHHERKDFITSILEDQKATGLTLTDREFQSNMAALFMAGYGTTAISISGILYQILREPAHMQRLQHELRATFQTAEEIEGSAIQHLPYLNACINESLRLLPPINTRFAGRTSPGATISGLYVPEGVFVYADIFTMQRSDAYWSDAGSFRPERWIGAAGSPYAGDARNAFRPFLQGTRACIGKQMALQTLRLVLANLAFRYDMDMVNKDQFVWERDVPSSLVWTNYSRVEVRLSKAGKAGQAEY